MSIKTFLEIFWGRTIRKIFAVKNDTDWIIPVLLMSPFPISSKLKDVMKIAIKHDKLSIEKQMTFFTKFFLFATKNWDFWKENRDFERITSYNESESSGTFFILIGADLIDSLLLFFVFLFRRIWVLNFSKWIIKFIFFLLSSTWSLDFTWSCLKFWWRIDKNTIFNSGNLFIFRR